MPSACVPFCEEKCHNLGKCDTVMGPGIGFCLPGCTCPNGTVWDGKTCVVPDQCHCKDEQGNIRPVIFIYYISVFSRNAWAC